MELYRITLAKWANELYATGKPARWNSGGVKVVYTASSRSLACLENIVHHTRLSLLQQFRIMVIYVPDDVYYENIALPNLPREWHKADLKSYDLCRPYGNEWVASNFSVLLRVPSALVKGEYNFLINMSHPDFKHITVVGKEPFFFDPRVK